MVLIANFTGTEEFQEFRYNVGSTVGVYLCTRVGRIMPGVTFSMEMANFTGRGSTMYSLILQVWGVPRTA